MSSPPSHGRPSGQGRVKRAGRDQRSGSTGLTLAAADDGARSAAFSRCWLETRCLLPKWPHLVTSLFGLGSASETIVPVLSFDERPKACEGDAECFR